EVLLEGLKSDDLSIRAAVISPLGQMGSDAKAAVPALIEALKATPVLPANAATLDAETKALLLNSQVLLVNGLRMQAASALGEIGPDARAAVPLLLDL